MNTISLHAFVKTLNMSPTELYLCGMITPSNEREVFINGWSYDIKVNGESPSNTMAIAVGDKLSFSATMTEFNDNSDVGSALTTHTVTEEDIVNGFEVKLDVYVKENGGRNSGKSDYFVVTYTFTPNN